MQVHAHSYVLQFVKLISVFACLKNATLSKKDYMYCLFHVSEEMGYLSESVLTLHCLQARKLRQKLADGKISDAAFLDVDDLITKQLGSH